MPAIFFPTLVVSILIFLITAIEYWFGVIIVGRIRFIKIRREEKPVIFNFVILIQIIFGIILLAISVYNYYKIG